MKIHRKSRKWSRFSCILAHFADILNDFLYENTRLDTIENENAIENRSHSQSEDANAIENHSHS